MKVLHIGPHKTGSTFLQSQVFPYLQGVNYYGDGSISACMRKNVQLQPNSIPLFSTEAALGYPYPNAKPPRIEEVMQLCADYGITHLLALKRPYPSWIRSIWFQYLNEGGTRRLDRWYQLNLNALESWRRLFVDLDKASKNSGIELKVFDWREMAEHPSDSVTAIAEFLKSDFSYSSVKHEKANVSRKGKLTILAYRNLNRIWIWRHPGRFAKLFRNFPRHLIQGRKGIGGALDRISFSTVASPEQLNNLSWFEPDSADSDRAVS